MTGWRSVRTSSGQLSIQPIHLDITSQADLAGLVATSRESVTRALAELRSRGAITTSRRYITIVDIRRLHEVAES